jgi:hypothetical protein
MGHTDVYRVVKLEVTDPQMPHEDQFSMGYYEGNDYSSPVPAPNEYNNLRDVRIST